MQAQIRKRDGVCCNLKSGGYGRIEYLFHSMQEPRQSDAPDSAAEQGNRSRAKHYARQLDIGAANRTDLDKPNRMGLSRCFCRGDQQ
jgi:hypothetical protein